MNIFYFFFLISDKNKTNLLRIQNTGNAHNFPTTYHDSTVVNLNSSTSNSTNRASNQIGDGSSNNEQDSNVPMLPLNCEVR